MKTLLPFLFILFSFFFAQAQDEAPPATSKGSFMIETGYNVIGGITSGSGFNLLSNDGTTLLGFGGDVGYFVADNLALKFKLALLGAFNSGDGDSITSMLVGGKYYLVGKVPIEVAIGIISGSGNTDFLANFLVGYAVPLAPNINIEPSVGIISSDGETLLNAKIPFVLFF